MYGGGGSVSSAVLVEVSPLVSTGNTALVSATAEMDEEGCSSNGGAGVSTGGKGGSSSASNVSYRGSSVGGGGREGGK